MSTPRSTPPDLEGFAFVRWIGGGGFADVFLYQQQRPNRPVAIKALRAEHLSTDSLRQFEMEADLMAEVSHHPYIVTIHAATVARDGRPCLVMEYYPQQHFGLRSRGGRLPLAEVLQVGVQVCSAVETAHRSGILHRDIKPANILTSHYHRPGLTDFGIAGVQIEGSADAAAGVTTGYAAPEVLQDEELRGSVVSDVYSLGATLYSLLAGRSPYWVPGGDNTEAALTGRILGGSLPPVGRADVPPAVEHLLRQALHRDPTARPQSALALARAIQDIEQSLRLPPTPIEAIRDDPAPATDHRPDDGDGTRRGGARVVDAQPDPAPARPDEGGRVVVDLPPLESPETVQRPSPRAPVAPAARPASGPRAEHSPLPAPETSGDTVRRSRPSTPVTDTTDGGTERASRRRWPLVVGAIAAAVVVVATVVLGGGDDQTPAAEPDPTSPPPTLPIGGPGQPTDVRTTFEEGVLRITFDSADGVEASYFRIMRTDGSPPEPWPDGDPYKDVDTSPATIEGLDVDSPTEVCFTVMAVSEGGQASEPTPEHCSRVGEGGDG